MLADVVLEPALKPNVDVVPQEVGETPFAPALLSEMVVIVGSLVVSDQVHLLTSQQAEQGVQGGCFRVHSTSLASSFNIDKLLVGRHCEQRVSSDVGDDPGFAENPIDLVFQAVLQPLDRGVSVRLSILPFVPDTPVSSEGKRRGEEKEEEPRRGRPALRSPLPWNPNLLTHRPQQGGDCRLQLVPQVVKGLEEVDIGEVKGVPWQAADQDMTKVEEDQSSPCLFISGEKIEVWPSASIALDYLLLLQKARMPLCSMYSSASRHFMAKECESVQLLATLCYFNFWSHKG